VWTGLIWLTVGLVLSFYEHGNEHTYYIKVRDSVNIWAAVSFSRRTWLIDRALLNVWHRSTV
jgi:hypothetical protein